MVPQNKRCIWYWYNNEWIFFQERKKEVKDARKEKLKTKTPKHVKKRGEKLAKSKKTH